MIVATTQPTGRSGESGSSSAPPAQPSGGSSKGGGYISYDLQKLEQAAEILRDVSSQFRVHSREMERLRQSPPLIGGEGDYTWNQFAVGPKKYDEGTREMVKSTDDMGHSFVQMSRKLEGDIELIKKTDQRVQEIGAGMGSKIGTVDGGNSGGKRGRNS